MRTQYENLIVIRWKYKKNFTFETDSDSKRISQMFIQLKGKEKMFVDDSQIVKTTRKYLLNTLTKLNINIYYTKLILSSSLRDLYTFGGISATDFKVFF